MKKIKYFTKRALIKANKEAIKTGRNRALIEHRIEELPDENKYPITWTMIHNDIEMRVQIVFNEKGESGWLDIPFETYNLLPEQEVQEVGNG